MRRGASYRARSGTLLVLLLGFGFVALGCDSLPGKPKEDQGDPAQSTDFELLYATHCAGCHGENGKLGPALSLHDPVYLALVPPERLRAVIEGGVPGTAMSAFAKEREGSLASKQIDALVQGMMTRWADTQSLGGAVLPPYAAPLGDPERGALVYAAACASCHGAEGRGGEKGHDIVDPSYLALVSDQALRSVVIAGRTDLGMPDWRENAGSPLTSQQVSDVVAWMAVHRAPVMGRPVFEKPGG